MKKRKISAAVFLLLALLAGPAPARQPATRPVDGRVDDLVSRLTLDEKITLLAGVDNFFTRPVERLGIPRVKMTDGPNGTRVFGQSTAYPAGVLLAATWDRELARREGEQLGRDARARDCQVLLGPGMNLYRHPQNGRNFEYFGEDPLLCGEIAVGYVRGLQSQGVSATAKHFVANNQETNRSGGSSEIDERTLRELYLRAFKRVIDEADPGAVMCAYNRLNGTYCSADKFLLTDVLRDEWGFGGIVMSDWGAVHDTLGPMRAGLDLEMPGPEFYNAGAIKPLLESGQVTEAMIDEKVRRLLGWMERFGWLDGVPPADESVPLDNPDGAAVALDVARAGITLLKNNDGLLPLDKNAVRKVVLVGLHAVETPVGGGGSGYTEPFHSVSIFDAFRAALGPDRLAFAAGDPFNKLIERPAVDGDAFAAEYFDNTNLEGDPVVTRDEKIIAIDINGGSGKTPAQGVKLGKFSARYRAAITPQTTGEYTFFTYADDGSRVLLDGRPVIDDWTRHGARRRTATATLEAGKTYQLAVEYFDAGGDAVLQFGCGPTPPIFTDAEVAALAEADAVVVCVGYGPRTESEGSDRTYALPGGQEAMILAAAAANPRTVVVLNAGGSCETAPWIGRVGGLLHAYYAGQEGGTAVAEVLFGDVNPSGRLPFTFERALGDVPSVPNWGMEGKVDYAEGLFVGYRGFDKSGTEPLYPFGFGLSYTTFDLGTAEARVDGDSVVVTAEVSNTGGRDGATVLQCYVEPPEIDLPRPAKELRAFAKVSLAAGEKRRVELRIPRDDLAYWDPAGRAWAVTPGTYQFHVGFDERDLPQTASADVP